MINAEPTEPFRSDPILALLPEDVPFSFHAMPPEEQAWRGRYFLVAWSAGYETNHAWWLAMLDLPEFIEGAKDTLSRVVDTEIPRMLEGRRSYEREIARQTALGGQ